MYKERISFLRSCLIESLKDRPEGFVRDGSLLPGQPYPETMEHIKPI